MTNEDKPNEAIKQLREEVLSLDNGPQPETSFFPITVANGQEILDYITTLEVHISDLEREVAEKDGAWQASFRRTETNSELLRKQLSAATATIAQLEKRVRAQHNALVMARSALICQDPKMYPEYKEIAEDAIKEIENVTADDGEVR